MSVGDGPSGQNVAAGDERLLVVVPGSRDRDLLAGWFDQRYDVVTATPDEEWPAFDACLVSAEWYGTVRQRLVDARDRATAYLPVLLLVPESRAAEPWVDRALDGPVDDVVSVPTRKRHLHARLSSVLRARRLSTDLAAERDRFRALTEGVTDAILTVDAYGTVRYANPAVKRVFGYDSADLVGEPITTLIPERFRDTHQEAFAAYLDSSERTFDWSTVEFTGLHADGYEVPIEVSLAEYRTDGERRFTGVIRDISERKAREAELQLTRRAMDEAVVGISIARADGDQPLVYVNEAFEAITGYTAAEALGQNCRFLQGPDTEEAPVAELRRAIEAQESTTVELRNYRKDGEPFWNEVTVAPVRDSGEVTHYVGFQKDVTERKESRLELEATAEAFRALYRIAADPDRSFEEKLDAILELGTDYLGVGTGYLTRIEDDIQTIVESAGEYENIQPGTAVPLDRSYCRTTIETGRLAIQNAPGEGWADDPGYDEFDIGSYLGARVDVGGDLYGTVCFADREPRERPFSDSERALAELISQWVTFELERLRREEELRATERQFEAVFQDPNIFVGLLARDGTVLDINDTAMAYVDATVEDVRGKQFAETPWFDDWAREDVRAWVERAATGEYVEFEADLERPDGDEYGLEGVFRPVTDEAGKVVSILVSNRDVTERKRLEAALQEEKKLLQQLFDTSPVAITVLNPDGEIVRANSTAEDVLRLAPSKAVGRRFDAPEWDIVDEDGGPVPPERLPFNRVMATGERITDFEHGIRTADGETVWLSISAAPLMSESGEIRRVVAAIQDVTERKRRERDLDRAFDLLEKAQELADIGAWEYDVAAAEMRVSDQARDIHDLPDDFEFTIDNYLDLYDGQHRDRLQAAWQDALAGTARELELVCDTPAGEEKWILFYCDPVIENGEVTQLRGTIQDVTEPLEREREVRRYETMVESASNPIYALDTEGRFTHVNEATVALTEHSREEVLGAHASAVFADAEIETITERIVDMLSSDEETTAYETTHEMPDGESRHFQVSVSLLFEDGEYDGVVMVAQDITEIRRHERRLSVLDRVFRHNVRNRLNVVAGHLAAIAESDDERVATTASKALAAADDLSELAEDARRFQQSIRPGEASVKRMDVTPTVAEIIQTARAEHPDASFRTDLPDEAWARVPESFAIAVEELLNNAVEHTDSDPTIEVSVREEADDIEIHVADDGPGIPAMTREALARGEETPLEHALGLGLWLVRWTATNAGGNIDIRDNEPRGTVVVLRLPRA